MTMFTDNGSEAWYDAETGIAQIVNESTIPTSDVMHAFGTQYPEVAAMVRWGNGIQQSRATSVFERDKYVNPGNVYDQMRVAYDAVENDDVVSNVLDTTEALTFGKLSFEAEDEEEEDVWNQIAADIDLDSRLREMWRELMTVSQFYCAVVWGRKTYKVRGKTEAGVKRKKVFANISVPISMSLLDPLRVIPVGNTFTNTSKLAYMAERSEGARIDKALQVGGDQFVDQIILGRYELDPNERAELASYSNVNTNDLFLLNPQAVWRHHATKSHYQKFSTVRMASVFELLDLKQQLRQMDRAHLIGATNFIILIKKGSKERPATSQELQALAAQTKISARIPVIVGDDRLSIEIITPKTDFTLKPERYNAVDGRITARLYGLFLLGNYQAGAQSDDSIKLARIVARGMESRRHMLRRSLEKYVFGPTVKQNEEFTGPAKLTFYPKRIALDFDPAVAAFLQDLRDRGDLSRDSMLAELDFDQADEARKREREAERFDKIFKTTVPFSGPGGNNSGGPTDKEQTPAPDAVRKSGGRNGGGNRNGGGSAPGSGQGQAPRNPRKKSD